MKYSEKTIALKDGRTAIFRAPSPVEDAEDTLAFLVQGCGETEYFEYYPEELPFDHQSEIEYLKHNIESDRTMMIMCTVDGKIAGNCQIIIRDTMKTRHRANLLIGLLKDYWNLGIGSAMIEEISQQAKQHGVTQLEVRMIAGNEHAIMLYKKMGFEIVSKMPEAYRLKDGSLHSAVYLRKTLE